MTKLVVSDAARQDLRDIAQYTERTWGAEQRHRYLDGIERRLAFLRRRPSAGSPRDEIRPGYRSLPVERHVIFYKFVGDVVEIVRILHGNIDTHRHLGARREE